MYFVVSVPPEEIHIYDEHHADIAIMLGPYNEGSDVNLVCEVKGGKYAACFVISSGIQERETSQKECREQLKYQ